MPFLDVPSGVSLGAASARRSSVMTGIASVGGFDTVVAAIFAIAFLVSSVIWWVATLLASLFDDEPRRLFAGCESEELLDLPTGS